MMVHRQPFLMIVAVLGTLSSAWSEDRELRLAECISMALKHNLDLASGQLDPIAARYSLDGAQSAFEPVFNAQVGRTSSTSPGGVDAETKQLFSGTETTQDSYRADVRGLLPSGMTYSLGANRTRTDGVSSSGSFFNEDGFFGLEIRQPLLKNLWIDTTRLQIKLGHLNLQMSESELQALLMQIVTNVEFAYYDLIAARDQLKIIQQSYELASQLVESHRKQVAVGRMARLDEKQAQARMAATEAALYTANNRVAERENHLKLLITHDFASMVDTRLVPTTPLQKDLIDHSRETSWAKALTQRPELTQAKIVLEREHIQLRFEKNQRLPTLDLTASYGYAGRGRDIRNRDTPNYGVGIGLTIPIGNGRAKARQRAQEVRQRQALLAFKKLEQGVMAQVADALNATNSISKRVAATGEARAFAEVALEAEEKKLANGKSTNFIVLQLQADLTQARLNETLALVDYNRSLAVLALREASTLERHAISLNQPN